MNSSFENLATAAMALDEKVVSSPVVFPTSLRNISVRGYKLAADALETWYQEQTKTDDLFDFNNMAMFIHQHINDSIMLVHDTRSLDLYLSLGHPGKPLGLIAELTVDRKAKNLLKQIGDSSVNATDHRVEEADIYPAPVPPPPVSENGYEQLVASEFGQKMKALIGRFQVMPEDTPGTLLWDGMPDSFSMCPGNNPGVARVMRQGGPSFAPFDLLQPNLRATRDGIPDEDALPSGPSWVGKVKHFPAGAVGDGRNRQKAKNASKRGGVGKSKATKS